jgi:hypothetical protein
MKTHTTLMSAALGLAALPLFLACTEGPVELADEPITVSPRMVTLRVGQTLRFEANVWAADRDGKGEIAWNSSEPEVATLLDNHGLVIAAATGSAVISAGCGEYCGTAFVTVIDPGGGESEEDPDGER